MATQGRSGAAALASAAAPDVRGVAHQLTARGPENLEVSPGPVKGSKIIRIRSGYSEVILAKTNPDGTVSTRCVDSPAGADAFLDSTTPSSIPKAAQ
jgi:hypothetical protein